MNLISILWQYEIPNINIVPTIIKTNHQSARYYFYSQKQIRVLRKKNINEKNTDQSEQDKRIINTENIKKIIMQLIYPKGSNQYNQYGQQREEIQCEGYVMMIVKQSSKHQNPKISLLLPTLLEVVSQLQKSQLSGHYCLIKNQQKVIRIKNICKGGKSSQFQILEVNQKLQQTFINKYTKFIKIWCKYLTKNIILSLKGKKSQQQQFQNNIFDLDFILSVNFNQICNKQIYKQKDLLNVKVIDAIKFICRNNNNTLLQLATNVDINISYELKSIKKQDKVKINTSGNHNKEKKEERVNIQEKFQIYLEDEQIMPVSIQNNEKQKCQGCYNILDAKVSKEVDLEHIRKIKKLHGISVRGLSEQYYSVCKDCYQKQF